MINREAIFQALFNLVKDLPLFVTTSRRGKPAKDVPAEEQPALFQEEGAGETIEYQAPGLPPKIYLYADLGFYARIPDDQTTAPGTVLNPLIDAICAALEPDPAEEEQTLGGRVVYCRIDGKILKNEGLLDGQASVVFPVKILAV
ncbi:MAG: hypothetical protein M1438_20005 [Deltaproteobacteria bacterium]|nr:hypothetical protein [Deltaproteobacteria bacterium]